MNTIMKIGVFGNRNITDDVAVIKAFEEQVDIEMSEVGSFVFLYGGAKGPQKILDEYITQNRNDITQILFKPWTAMLSSLIFNPMYFYLRNRQIVENSDIVIFFTNGEHDSEVTRVEELVGRLKKPCVRYTI